MNIDDVPKGIPMPMIETPYPPRESRIIVRDLVPVLSWGNGNGLGYSVVVRGRHLDEQHELHPFALLLSRDVRQIRAVIRSLEHAADEMERRQP